ncbi:MAG: choice-of-anchor D domain-containing protein, partial [Verrucomicrobiota bacterium]
MNPKSTLHHWHPKPLGSALALFLSFACMALAAQFASAATRVVSVNGDLEFGQVAAGSTAQRTVTISNTGNQNLVVQSIQYPSGFSGDFVSGPVHPGDSQLVTVTFAPTSATAYGGTVTVTCNKTSGTNTLAISGTGTNPPPTRIISLSGDLAFPSVLVGSSAQLTLTITNSGNSPLSVTGISLPTGFSGDFSGSIAANGTQAVTITFSPTDAVGYLGTVTVQSDSTAGGNTVSASGTGLALTRTVSLGGTLDFGDVTVGASAQRTLYITNAGNSTLTVSDITYPTAFDGAFSGAIAPGAVQSVLVTFSPSVETSYAGTVTVNSDATSGINTANASGNGTPVPTKFISLSGDLEFGGVLAGSSAQLTFSITNAGTAVLNISNINYPTGFSGDFNSGAMDPGAVQSVVVTFSPVAAVDYTGTVTVDSDAASGLNSFTISGIGTNLPVNPIIALSDALDFGDV